MDEVRDFKTNLERRIGVLKNGDLTLGNVRFEVGSFTAFQTYEREFDGAYMTYGVLNMLSDQEINSLFARTWESLRVGGILVIDLLNKPHVINTSRGGTVNLMNRNGLSATRQRRVSTSGDYEETQFTINVSGKEEIYLYQQRLFDIDHMTSFLEKTGYAVVRKCGGFNGDNWSVNSSRMILIAEKR